jgi:hypothetical protein
MISEPGPPMTLGNAAAALGRCVSKHSIRARRRLLTRERTVNAYPPLMFGQLPPRHVSGLLRGGSIASIRSSPIPPIWLLGAAPKRACSIGRERLVCSTCGSRQIEMVVTGNRRQSDG